MAAITIKGPMDTRDPDVAVRAESGYVGRQRMIQAVRSRVVGFLAACLGLFPGGLTAADDPDLSAVLTVVVSGARSNQGKMHFALYNVPKDFTKKAIDGGAVEIKEGQAQWTAQHLKPGEYAVACFHDENDDGKFNQGFLGIPLEDYAFSNGARAGLGPPSWKKVVFTIKPGVNRHLIKIKGKS